MTGDRFKEIRDEIGASQRQLAELLQVGKGTIHRMEKKEGHIKRVYALAMKHLEAHPDLFELWFDEKTRAESKMRESILRGA